MDKEQSSEINHAMSEFHPLQAPLTVDHQFRHDEDGPLSHAHSMQSHQIVMLEFPARKKQTQINEHNKNEYKYSSVVHVTYCTA